MQNKQQDYLKQREKLKYVTQSHLNQKALDPDLMIEQLISDKETFQFNASTHHLPYSLPKWLKSPNNLVPALYEQVWQAVKLGPTYQFCDTYIITQFFTSSGLSLEKLGHLWSLTNVCSPGVLTQQELYVMLTLIALVQAGYNVKDISIIKSINHPILPQLDYSFLNITVANPAINRSTSKQAETNQSNTIFSNGFNSTYSGSVPSSMKSANTAKKSTTLDASFSRIPESRKPEVDIILPTSKLKKTEYNVNSIDVDKVTELDVDFPISDFRVQTKPTQTGVQLNSGTKSLNFLSNRDFAIEPKSLDLPIFNTETNNIEDDEFTEFQSATIAPVVDDYTDFQSASPIVKYELDNFMNQKNAAFEMKNDLNLTVEPKLEALPQSKSTFLDSFPTNNDQSDDDRIYKSLHEADKYDVFRSLVEHNAEETKAQDNEESEDEEVEEEGFGDFYAAADTSVKGKPAKISIKEKCLEACLRLLQEGLTIFSNISSKNVISEVLSDERGYRYLNQLKIVYETSQRFQRQFEHVRLNDELQMAWAKLSSYTKYLPSEDLLEDEVYAEDDVDASLCKLCETKCDINCVRYARNYYHVTCINLFLHFVEDSEISAMLNL